MLSSSRDNWERLVAAVIKKQQLWEMFHSHSRSPSVSSLSSDVSSILETYEPHFPETVSQSASVDVTISSSVSSETNTATGFFTRKLFSRLYRRSKPKHQNVFETIDEDDPELHIGQFIRFSRSQLEFATDNFHNRYLLARSGFGIVYRGRLANGIPVAIKRIQNKEPEFKREIDIMSVAAHPNIINLLGFCTTLEEYLMVYPLAVNGSVASILRDGRSDSLSGITRKKISLGAAKGLSYLHEECEPRIIHRDVKAANILLDEEFQPIICDFHLAIVSTNQIDVHAVFGTIGHIAPEYLSKGHCSEKSDVYSYGVFLLELISGMRAFHLEEKAFREDISLVNWVWRILHEERFEKIAEVNLWYDNDEANQDNGRKVVKLLLQMSLICTSHCPEHRPKMSEVVTMLEDDNCLAERWEECVEYQRNRMDQINKPSPELLVIYDSSDEILAEDLSGPR